MNDPGQKKRQKNLALCLALAACLLLPAKQSAAVEGINSSGSAPLPIGAGDTVAMKVWPGTQTTTGAVGIGITGAPAANLEVARGLKIGQDEGLPNTNPSGSGCSGKEGTLSKGPAGDNNLYLCAKNDSGSVVWKTLGRSGSVYGLQSVTGVKYGAWTVSGPLQYNASGSAPVSVTPPGFLSINNGPWIQSGTISTGQSIRLGVTAPYANFATVSVTLTTGSEQDVWSVRTATATYVTLSYCGADCGSATCYLGTACSQSFHSFNPSEYNCNDNYYWNVATANNSPSYSCSMYNRCGTGGARSECGPYVVLP